MADFDSSLPIRTQSATDVKVSIADNTITSQFLTINADGSLNITDNGASITVDATDFDIRDLVFATDKVDVTGSSVTATQGTSPWVTKDQADGPVTPGTVSSFSILIGGQFNTVLPVLTNGQQAAIQVDSSGRLLVNTSNSDDHNYGIVGANTLRTAAQIGNATGAADFNAGATGAQTLRVQANQGAPNTNANGWFVRVTDGTNNVSVTATGAAHVTADNFPTTVDTNYGAVGANTIRTASQVGNATGAADFNNGATSAQTLRVAANLAVGGANVTAANPVPVTMEAAPGTHINDYKRAIAIAAGATDNHDYTVTAGKTLYLNQVESTGSGKTRMEVEVETGVATGTFLTSFTQFNSTANPIMHVDIKNAIVVAAGVRVRLAMKNADLTAQDIYSTISGYEL